MTQSGSASGGFDLTPEEGLFAATCGLVLATLVLAYFTLVLGRHARDLNNIERARDQAQLTQTRIRLLASAIEAAGEVILLNPHLMWQEIFTHRPVTQFTRPVRNLRTAALALGVEEQNLLVRLSSDILAVVDSAGVESEAVPEKGAFLKQVDQLKEKALSVKSSWDRELVNAVAPKRPL
ncbi:TPA: hypothetical protein HA259_01715 [Thermoplasmata archaeon]|nr:hypothetical protein [Thermoplasmata archaeon]